MDWSIVASEEEIQDRKILHLSIQEFRGVQRS